MRLLKVRNWAVLLLAVALSGAYSEVVGAQQKQSTALAEISRLQAEARRLRLSEDPMWWRLLHYEPTWFGVESEADGELFFNSPSGKHDPAAELEATIQALFGAVPTNSDEQHPYCRFPARLAWLNAELPFDFSILPQQSCEDWDEFHQTTNAESLSLIFSSYYLNNPASATGHTLLRLNKRKKSEDDERQALLDYGVNFGASVDTGNAVLYALKGLLGLFPGEMSRVPYYFKVREYNDYESRDLWEFELDLTEREVQMAVAHIWELGSTYFDYYYLTENCAYQMLKILEVARLGADLSSKLGWPVLPADTLMAVAQSPKMIRRVSYRPSARRQFHHRVEGLSGPEVVALERVVHQPDAPLPARLTQERRVAVLDAALDLVDFRYSKALLEPNSPESALKQQLLKRRAQYRVPSKELNIAARASENPLAGHDVRRVDLGLGHSSDRGPFQALDFRLALHDLGDPGLGYPDTLSINFLPTRLRYYPDRRRFELERLHLVAIASLAPIDNFSNSISWNVTVGAERIRDRGCESCLAGVVEVGGGVAVATSNRAVTAYTIGGGRLVGLAPIAGGLFGWPLRAGALAKSGVRLRLLDDWVAHIRGEAAVLPGQTPRLSARANAVTRWMYTRNFAIALEGELDALGSSVQLSSSLYF